MDKQEHRPLIREKKRAMTQQEILKASDDLARQLYAHPAYRQADAIYGYLSYNQEVRTLPMLQQALADGKLVAVPKVVGERMIFVQMNDLSRIQKGYCGIPEPMDDSPQARCRTALVLMPGLAFDPQGHRLGYGGGFYDRFLEEEPDHPTLALCYDFQLLDHVETEAHDIPVDYVLTSGSRKEAL